MLLHYLLDPDNEADWKICKGLNNQTFLLSFALSLIFFTSTVLIFSTPQKDALRNGKLGDWLCMFEKELPFLFIYLKYLGWFKILNMFTEYSKPRSWGLADLCGPSPKKFQHPMWNITTINYVSMELLHVAAVLMNTQEVTIIFLALRQVPFVFPEEINWLLWRRAASKRQLCDSTVANLRYQLSW